MVATPPGPPRGRRGSSMAPFESPALGASPVLQTQRRESTRTRKVSDRMLAFKEQLLTGGAGAQGKACAWSDALGLLQDGHMQACIYACYWLFRETSRCCYVCRFSNTRRRAPQEAADGAMETHDG